MKALELNDLEKDIIAKCNELTKPHGLEVGKHKVKQSTKYCITQDGYNILSNDDLIQVHKFCQDKSDLETLALTAPAMVKSYKEKEAVGA